MRPRTYSKTAITSTKQCLKSYWAVAIIADLEIGTYEIIGLWTKVLDAGHWALDAGLWMLDSGQFTPDAEPWPLESRR